MKTRFFTLVIRDLWHTVLDVVRLWIQITQIYFCLRQRKEESMSFQIKIDGDHVAIELATEMCVLVEGEPIGNVGSNIRPVNAGDASGVFIAGNSNVVAVNEGRIADDTPCLNPDDEEDMNNGEE